MGFYIDDGFTSDGTILKVQDVDANGAPTGTATEILNVLEITPSDSKLGIVKLKKPLNSSSPFKGKKPGYIENIKFKVTRKYVSAQFSTVWGWFTGRTAKYFTLIYNDATVEANRSRYANVGFISSCDPAPTKNSDDAPEELIYEFEIEFANVPTVAASS